MEILNYLLFIFFLYEMLIYGVKCLGTLVAALLKPYTTFDESTIFRILSKLYSFFSELFQFYLLFNLLGLIDFDPEQGGKIEILYSDVLLQILLAGFVLSFCRGVLSELAKKRLPMK